MENVEKKSRSGRSGKSGWAAFNKKREKGTGSNWAAWREKQKKTSGAPPPIADSTDVPVRRIRGKTSLSDSARGNGNIQVGHAETLRYILGFTRAHKVSEDRLWGAALANRAHEPPAFVRSGSPDSIAEFL